MLKYHNCVKTYLVSEHFKAHRKTYKVNLQFFKTEILEEFV